MKSRSLEVQFHPAELRWPKTNDCRRASDRCHRKFDRIVLTKVDEAVKIGVVFDVLSRIQKDLSFITTGQEIPRDIEIADSSRIAFPSSTLVPNIRTTNGMLDFLFP